MTIDFDGRRASLPPVSGLRLLIVSPASDPHAIAVADRLAGAGHTCVRWSTEDVFRQGKTTLFCGSNGGSAAAQFDLAWIRKVVIPRGSAPDSFEMREHRAVAESILLSVELGCRTINPYSSILLAQHKAIQLRHAAAAGASIPATIITQDPDAVRTLMATTTGRLVYKPLTSSRYIKDGETRVIPTTRLTPEQLQDDALLSASFGIYQEEIDRICEARITLFGDCAFVAIAKADAEDSDLVDWRVIFAEQRFTAGIVPDETVRQCRQMMQSLKLEYGAFDFVQRKDGQWFFLEVNDAGNFLFLKSMADQITDALTNYLVREARVSASDRSRKTATLRSAG